MSGEFFQGLAKGIFGSMADQNRQAAEAEAAERQKTLNLLGTLADEVDEESKPILYQQMAEVMKLKGPTRGLWDELTGKGRWAGRDALREKGAEILGTVR